jgi:dimethylamine/trimethylamine dehydrogenase
MTFASRFIEAYEGEISGEAYFAELARLSADTEVKAKLQLLVDVEIATQEAIFANVKSLGGPSGDLTAIRDRARARAAQHSIGNWADIVERFCQSYPKYVDEYVALVDLADPANRMAAQLLANHEIAIVEFARAEKAGDPQSCVFLTRFLNQTAAS